jgi:hypothetical protein
MSEATTPRRIRRSRAKGARLPENTICVDRSTKWGNPFVVGKHGTRAECVDLYKKLLAGYICISNGPAPSLQMAYRAMVIACRHELRGANVACWCGLCARHAAAGGKPVGITCRDCAPCHGDPLLDVAALPDNAPVSPILWYPPSESPRDSTNDASPATQEGIVQ